MIVITRPFMQTGGVAQFVNTLEPFFDNDTVSFERGKRTSSGFLGFTLPFVDIIRFILFMIRKNPDVVIVNSSLSYVGVFRDGFFVFISKLFNCRTILYIHGFKEKALRMRVLIKFGYFKSDKIYVLSERFKNLLIQSGYLKEIEVSYNPVEIELLQCPIKDIPKLAGKEPVKILMMSRIEESKGVFIGLEMMRELKNRSIQLHVAGIGTHLDNAIQFVKDNELNNVTFHGFVTGQDKLDLIKDSDILLFPPLAPEGLPINILESLSLGLYVVSRPEGGIVDLNENYYMIISESKDPISFKKIIEEIISSNPEEGRIMKNQQNARIDFSPSEILSKLTN